MRLRIPMLIAAAVAVAAALVAAGCGGGDKKGAAGGGGATKPQVLKMAWGAEPPSLDPGLATDTTSSNMLLNIMDPLVQARRRPPSRFRPGRKLGRRREGRDLPSSRRRSLDERRPGDRARLRVLVEAHDLDPKLAADYAYQFYGIVGAEVYNSAKPAQAAALKDKVGVKALDDRTPASDADLGPPWFVQQMAHHSFLVVHEPTVEKYGTKWTEPRTSSRTAPFKLAAGSTTPRSPGQEHGVAQRGRGQARPGRGPIIVDGTTPVQAFEAGEVDALDGGGLPPADMPRLKQTPEYEKYPALGTYYYGFNMKNIPDVNQRRAMALAIDRHRSSTTSRRPTRFRLRGWCRRGCRGST